MTKIVRAVVTGGCGFIGSHIVESLVKQGIGVTVLDDLSSGKLENLQEAGAPVNFVKGDVRDPVAVREALAGCEILFHEAAFVSVPESVLRPEECYDINIGGMKRLLEEAERQGTGTVVFASSCAVYGNGGDIPLRENSRLDPLSPYAMSKTESERLLEEFCSKRGARGVALRYFNVYGPRQTPESKYAAVISKFFLDAAVRKVISLEGGGVQTRDFIFARDVAETNILAARSGPGGYSVFNVCSGEEISISGLAGLFGEMYDGLEVRRIEGRKDDILRSCGSCEKARSVLNFRPSVDLREGLRITREYLSERSSG